MEENTPFIELKKVSKYYSNANNVSMGLHQISIKMNINEIIAITGQSGSGKSTFLNVVSKVDSYEDGELYFNGKATSYFSQEDDESFRRNNVGFIFQNYNLVDSYTVKQNVMLPLLIQGKTVAEASTEALKIIERVGLKDRENHRGTKLSGGEKQRCVIARALASDSKILACDEPTGNLDSKTSKEIIDLLYEVSKDRLLLIVTHNFDEVADIATRNIEFSDGEIIRDTKLKDVEHSDFLPVDTESKDNKLLKNVQFKLAFQNLIKTPKKTTLSFIVLLFASIFAALVCIAYSVFLDSLDNEKYYYYDQKGTVDEDRNVISKVDDSPIDLDNLANTLGIDKNQLYEYSDYEEKHYDLNITSKNFVGDIDFGEVYIQNHIPKWINTYCGKQELSGNDEIFILTSGMDFREYCSLVGKTINISLNDEQTSHTFKVKGMGLNEYTGNTVFYFSNRKYYDQNIYDNLKTDADISAFDNNNNIICNYHTINVVDNVDHKLKDHILYINTPSVPMFESYKERFVLAKPEFSLITEPYYEHSNPFLMNNISFDFTLVESGIISLSMTKNTYENIINTCCRKVSIYSLSENEIKKKLKNTDYVYSNIKTSSHQADPIGIYLSKILMFIVIVVGIVIIYFITYFVLGRVYKSKNRDYTILRTLGVSKKQMAKIVRYELLYMSLLCLIIIFVVEKLIPSTSTNQVLVATRNVKFIEFILFSILFVLFAIKIGQRFNKLLFNNTVNKTLKKEETQND